MDEGSDVELLSIAVDFQGADVVRPYVDKANPSFTTVVDSENVLARLLGFKALPNGYFLEPGLKLSESIKGRFDIRNPEILKKTLGWINSPALHDNDSQETIDESMTSDEQNIFDNGLMLYQKGNVQEAISEWRKIVNMDPKNWIVRKQIWAILYPDKFYDAGVDFDWQRLRIEAESTP